MQALRECVLPGPGGDVTKQRRHYLSKGCPIQGSTSRVLMQSPKRCRMSSNDCKTPPEVSPSAQGPLGPF